MFSHCITKYRIDGKMVVVSWLQIKILGKIWAFSKQEIEVQ